MSDQVGDMGGLYLAEGAESVVPEGCKLTEVGVIPADWVVTTLGAHAAFTTGPFGSALHKSDYVGGGVPIVNPMQIVNGKIYPTYSMAITEFAATKLREFRLSVGDIVIGRRGDMGRCAVVTSIEDGWLCGTGSMIIRIKVTADPHFLQLILSSEPVVVAIENASVGTTMINLNQSTLRELNIALPAVKQEQTAIATALSDVDALISEQEKLIAKKQAIKTATMQQLLTGRTRLPQFALREDGSMKGYKQSELGEVPEDWEVTEIEPLVSEISMGPFGSDITVSNFVSSGVPVLNGYNVSSSRLKENFKNFVSEAKAKSLKKAVASRGDVVVTHRGTIGQMSYIPFDSQFEKYVISQSQFRIRFNRRVEPYWVVIYFLSEQGSAMLLEGKGHTGVPAIAQPTTTFRKLKVPVPSAREQIDIIAILSDLDMEIEESKAHLEKTRQIKQGMMQELLTGKTRLLKPEQLQ